MPNPFLSARIPAELNQQIEEFLARTGETKTEMLARAVAAYIGAEAPPLKATGDRRIENLELVVAELQGAVKSLYEKLAALTPKIENSKVELEPITTPDNNTDNSDNNANNTDTIEDINKIDYTFTDIENTVNNSDNKAKTNKENTFDNSNNKAEVTYPTDVTPAIDNNKTFLEIETAEVAKLTKLDAKKFTDLRGSFNRKLKKENQPLPENKKLDRPIKMTPPSGVKIEKVPYDVFYVGQSAEGRNLWNLIPQNSPTKQLDLLDNI